MKYHCWIGHEGCTGTAFNTWGHGLSQDLETGCPKLTIVKFLGVLFFKGGHAILIP